MGVFRIPLGLWFQPEWERQYFISVTVYRDPGGLTADRIPYISRLCFVNQPPMCRLRSYPCSLSGLGGRWVSGIYELCSLVWAHSLYQFSAASAAHLHESRTTDHGSRITIDSKVTRLKDISAIFNSNEFLMRQNGIFSTICIESKMKPGPGRRNGVLEYFQIS